MKPMDKILIVADDRMFLKSLKAGLQNYMGQFEVQTVPNGDKALNILNGERISIVVSDINQPKTNGLDLLSYLEKNRPQVPCILMAAPESSAAASAFARPTASLRRAYCGPTSTASSARRGGCSAARMRCRDGLP